MRPRSESWSQPSPLSTAIGQDRSRAGRHCDPAFGPNRVGHGAATRLAAKHDAVAKPVAGFLVLARQGAAKTITGLALPTIRLSVSDLAEWRYRHSARKPWG